MVLSKTCSTVHPKAYYLARVTFFGLGGRALQRSKFHIGVSMERDRDTLLERWNLLGKGSKDNIHFILLKINPSTVSEISQNLGKAFNFNNSCNWRPIQSNSSTFKGCGDPKLTAGLYKGSAMAPMGICILHARAGPTHYSDAADSILSLCGAPDLWQITFCLLVSISGLFK